MSYMQKTINDLTGHRNFAQHELVEQTNISLPQTNIRLIRDGRLKLECTIPMSLQTNRVVCIFNLQTNDSDMCTNLSSIYPINCIFFTSPYCDE